MGQISEVKQQITDLQGQMSAYHNLITTTRTNINNRDFVERAIAGHRKSIQHHEQMIAQYEASLVNGEQVIDETKRKMQAVKKTLTLLKYKEQIEKLKEMHAQIQQLGGNNGDERVSLDINDMQTNE